MIFCHALAPLPCPFDCSHLNISNFEWCSKCWTSSLVIPICSFHVLLCAVRALEPVYVEPVYGLVVLIKVGMRSIISPTQASKALLFARATATVYAFFPLRSSFGLALGSDTSGWFSGNFIKRFLSGIFCLVTFCFRTIGEITLLFIWMSSNIQLRKDLDATYCFFAACLFRCHVLLREVNVLCVKH